MRWLGSTFVAFGIGFSDGGKLGLFGFVGLALGGGVNCLRSSVIFFSLLGGGGMITSLSVRKKSSTRSRCSNKERRKAVTVLMVSSF